MDQLDQKVERIAREIGLWAGEIGLWAVWGETYPDKDVHNAQLVELVRRVVAHEMPRKRYADELRGEVIETMRPVPGRPERDLHAGLLDALEPLIAQIALLKELAELNKGD